MVEKIGGAKLDEASRKAAEEAAKRAAAAEAARRQAQAEARQAAAAPRPAVAKDGAGLAEATALENQAGPRGAVELPGGPQGVAAADFEGFEGFDAGAAKPPGAPVFDAKARDAFIADEVKRLGLTGDAATQKQQRMLKLFRQADQDGDGVVSKPGELDRLQRGLIAGARADAILQQLPERLAGQARAMEEAAAKAKEGNVVSRGFNSFMNVFNGNMDQMDQAKENAVNLMRSELPQDLKRYSDMVEAAGGDPAKLQQAEEFLQGAMAKAEQAGKEFEKRVGDFSSSNKFWSGLAADVGAGLLVVGGAALAITGFGAPIGAGMIAAGFAAGGTASVGLRVAFDNQYDIKKEGLTNFVVGGIGSAATIATAGAAAGVTTGIASKLGQVASNQAITAGLTSFAGEASQGFQDGWMLRVGVGTATGAVLGKAAAGVAGGVASKLVPAAGQSALGQAAAKVATGAAAGAVGSGGGALVNEAIEAAKAGRLKEGWEGRVGQAALGGAIAGGVQSLAPDLQKAAARKFVADVEQVVQNELYEGHEGKVPREKIEADTEAFNQHLAKTRKDSGAADLDAYAFADARMEKLARENPARLQAMHDEAFRRFGVDPAKARQIIDAYTTSSTASNAEMNKQIETSVENVVTGKVKPADYNDMEKTIAAMLATRRERRAWVADKLGVPLPEQIAVNRGSPRPESILQAAEALLNGDKALTLNNRPVTSTSTDPATAIDFNSQGPRYQKTVGSQPGAKFRGTHGDYVAYNLDVPADRALFDKWTDGAASTQGPLAQRVQREVLVVGERNSQVVQTDRIQISWKGKLYNSSNIDELRAVFPQMQAEIAARTAKK